ncbi:MAG: major paralogous protein, partial [Bacteroidetes bacterium]|nr:major paralogous protein [Bacteroidota bacterium]
TGIEAMNENETGKISFYPNPMKDYAKMQFILPEPGETMVSLYDISGREITHTKDLLSAGKHVYVIKGVKAGIYLAKVNSGRYSFSGKLISSGSQVGDTKIFYENTLALQEMQRDSKGTNEEKIMQYTAGDRLLLKGISGIYNTVITDVPTAGKTITFNFIPCTDKDDNNYPIVQIGSEKGTTGNSDQESEKGVQIWMAENLKTTHYKDGSTIPLITVGDLWKNLDTPAYCWFSNDETKYKNTYGALYNWYAVKTAMLCPLGWHMPTDEEWTALTDYLGGTNDAGGKLKETGTTHWKTPNTGATNETGFRALPGGWRDTMGSFGLIESEGDWWSATGSETTMYATYRFMRNNVSNVSAGGKYKTFGLSVRCVLN